VFKWFVWVKNILSRVLQKHEQSLPVEIAVQKKTPRRSLKQCRFQSNIERRTLIYNMMSESKRLESFKYWACTYVHPIDLARDGWFYFNQVDYVQCAFCYGIISDWEENDVVEEEHKKHFPYCPKILNLPTDNIPLRADQHNLYIYAAESEKRYIPNNLSIDEVDGCKFSHSIIFS
jgi:hypothetical protein